MSIQNAAWIADGQQAISPVFQKTVIVKKPVAGQIEITGLGFFILTVNGRPVSDARCMPALSDYEARDMRTWLYPLYDTTHHRIYYLKFDLTPYLRDGDNVFEIHLGPGWYRQEERTVEGPMSFSRQLKTVFDGAIQCADGTQVCFASDGSERWYESLVLYSNLFIGEIQDASLLEAERDYKPVTIVDRPNAELSEQDFPFDRVIRHIEPILLSETDGVRVYDAGENITGHVALTMKGGVGREVTLRFGEEYLDGAVNFHSSGGFMSTHSGGFQIQTDVFRSGDVAYTFTPLFTWHAFRYFEVRGDLDAVESLCVEVVHTDVAVTSTFYSSHPFLNRLYDVYLRTQLDNLHGCIPSDCPHRERLGYTGDGQITAHAAMTMLDMRGVYRKWIVDILDCQDRISGHVQHTAPAMGGGGGPGGWGCAMVIVPDEYDRHYDDVELLRRCYPAMKHWIAYLKCHTEGGLVVREEKDGWCLGDWAFPAGEAEALPESFVNSCYLLDALRRMVRIARRLDETADIDAYEQLAQRVRDALIAAYYDAETGSFCEGRRGADAYALWVELAQDARTLHNLVVRYNQFMCFDTGFLGTEILIDVLLRHSQAELAYALLTARGENTYEQNLSIGGTTLCEFMDGRDSHNHPMFGAPVAHFFDGFLGIRQATDSVGYHKLVIEPQIPRALSHAKGSVQLPTGTVSVGFEQSETGVLLALTLPTGGATVRLCGREYTLNGGFHTLFVPNS